MRCTVASAINFVVLALIFGTVYAAVDIGLKYLTAGVLQFVRNFSAGVACMLVMFMRAGFEKGYWEMVKTYFSSGFWPIFHLCLGGFLNLGAPHLIIGLGQKWLPTATIQISMPLVSVVSNVFAHFLLSDEPFTSQKLKALIAAVAGVVISSVPPFLHPSKPASLGEMAIGFLLLFLGLVSFGFAIVYLKLKNPGLDVTVSSMVQLFSSAVCLTVWNICVEGPSELVHQFLTADVKGYWIGIGIGVVAGCIGMHGYMLLITTIGASGASFMTVGQLLVGVAVGVSFLHEWDAYEKMEIAMNVVGIILLVLSIVFGFYETKDEKKSRIGEYDILTDSQAESTADFSTFT